MHKAFAKEQEDHAITKKANNALKKKYYDLDEKHKELELQYSILWDSNSHPSKAKDTSTTTTSQGCCRAHKPEVPRGLASPAKAQLSRRCCERRTTPGLAQIPKNRPEE